MEGARSSALGLDKQRIGGRNKGNEDFIRYESPSSPMFCLKGIFIYFSISLYPVGNRNVMVSPLPVCGMRRMDKVIVMVTVKFRHPPVPLDLDYRYRNNFGSGIWEW